MDNINEEIKEPTDVLNTLELKSRTSLKKYLIVILVLFVIIFYFIFSSPSRDKDVVLHISPSDTLAKISSNLEKEKVIRYPFVLKLFVRVFSGDKHISSGDYLFKKGESAIGVSIQLARGKHNIERIRVTLKEGITKEEMADLLAEKIPAFNKDLFLNDSRAKEGYLFPDTYFFYPMSTTDEVIDSLTSNFNKKIASIDKDIKSSGKNLSEIITMASILEKEAGGKNDVSFISGILWKRLKLGMPLQVDAAPITYEEAGLPDKPISNPGLLSIKAAINPKESPYLFYLHDDSGQVHFALDFSEHRSNIAHYLK